MNITIPKQKYKKKTKRKYKKTKRKYNTKRRKYYKRGGAAKKDGDHEHDAGGASQPADREISELLAAIEVARADLESLRREMNIPSLPTETEFPDGTPLDCREIKGKTLYVSKSLNEGDDYDLIYITNFENGKWTPGEDLQPIILTSAPTKIGLLLKSLGEYIPLDPDFNVKELIKVVRDLTDYEADYAEEDINGKVLFEVTQEFIESKKSELFTERLKYCKTCVIGAGPGYNKYSRLDDFHRWSAHDPYFIGFSHMDTLLIEPFTANWLEDPDIFRRGFEICKPHLPNGKFEHIFIDRGTVHHLDEGGTDAFTPLLEAIRSTDISDRLCIDDMFFRRMFEDLLTEDIPEMEYYRIPKPGGGFYKDETGAQQVRIEDLGVSEMDIKKPENKINTLAELKSDPKILIKTPDLYGFALCASRFLKSIDYTDKGELIERHFNRTDETIEIDNGRDGKNTFHIFTKRT